MPLRRHPFYLFISTLEANLLKPLINRTLGLLCIILTACTPKDYSQPQLDQASPKNSEPLIADTLINEGPYIFHNAETLDIQWLCDGKVNKSSISVDRLPYQFDECDLSASVKQIHWENRPFEYKGEFQIAAFSDSHGQYDLLIKLLENNGIIDHERNWLFGNGHLVITGDVFDRGSKVTEILWFLFELERQALRAGGNLHLLLGNHEAMILNGDLRYLNEKYEEVASILGVSYESLYSKDSILGAWLRSKNVLVKVNDYLFAHGGIHPDLATKGYSLKSINQTFRDYLVKAETSGKRTSFAEYLHTKNGPIWYRGYFREPQATSEEIDNLLNHFDINSIVVGHTSQKEIIARYQGKVIAIDASMKKGHYGELLFINNDKRWRGNIFGEVLPLRQ